MKSYQENFGLQLGKAVKKLREDKGLSQEGLRKEAELSTGYISRFEAGEFLAPSIAQIISIAKALGMTLRDLLEFARLIPEQSTFEGALRQEGLNQEQIDKLISYKDFLLDNHGSAK